MPDAAGSTPHSNSRRLEGDTEGISLLLKKPISLQFGFVVGGKSARAFPMWEAEGRGEGVVCVGQRRKNPQPFVIVVSCHYF